MSSFEHIFLDATAEVEGNLVGTSSGDSDEVVTADVDAAAMAYQEATVVAFAGAIAAARAEKEKCTAAAAGLTGAGEEDDLNIAGCAIKTVAYTDAVIRNAVAEASATAAASACGGSLSNAEATAQAEVCPLTRPPHVP